MISNKDFFLLFSYLAMQSSESRCLNTIKKVVRTRLKDYRMNKIIKMAEHD